YPDHSVAQKYVGIEVERHRIGKPPSLARRVGLRRHLQRVAQLRELTNGLDGRLRNGVRDVEEPRSLKDVLRAASMAVEEQLCRPDQRRNATVQNGASRRRRGDPGKDVNEGGLAGPVLPDDAKEPPPRKGEAHVAES